MEGTGSSPVAAVSPPAPTPDLPRPSAKEGSQIPAAWNSPHGSASVHLDALRGIAAVGVCLNHLRDLLLCDYTQLPRPNRLLEVFYLATGLGPEWVMIFFVLSGYLVGGSVLRAFAADRWSWRGYLLNRMTRLYVVLVPALLLGGALDIAGLHFFGANGIYGGNTGSHEMTYPVAAHLSLKALVGNYLFLQGIRVPVFGSNGPLWSLANEFWYYLALPLMVLTAVKTSSLATRLVSAILLLLMTLFVGHYIALFGLVWLMGVAIHFLPPRDVQGVFLRRALMLVAVAITCATLAWCKAHGRFADNFLLGAAVTLLIYVVLCCSRTPVTEGYRATAHFFSRSSYTLYLVHVPFLAFVVQWTGRIRLRPDGQQLGLTLGLFVATLVYTQVVWFFFERRTDRLRDLLRPLLFRGA